MTGSLSHPFDQPSKFSKFTIPWWLERTRGRSRPLAVGPLAALALVLAPAAVAPSVASADPTCTTTGTTRTCTVSTIGTQTWTVPAGVTSATFDVFGAQGGAGDGATGAGHG